MVFYNGFNLLVDTILVFVGMVVAWRIAKREGFILGYGAGQHDTLLELGVPYYEALPSDFWEHDPKNNEEYL